MWKKRYTALAAASTLLLTACSGWALSDAAPEEEVPVQITAPAEVSYEEPAYEVIPFTTGNLIQAEDGTVLARYSYQTVRLSLSNADAVSPEDGEAAARNVAAFNEKMQSVSDDLAQQGEGLGELYQEVDTAAEAYEDNAETTAVFTGDILSVCMRRCSYTGGAHYNQYVLGWLFDIQTGQFILDPSQLADDPSAFHDGAAELLIEKADSDLPGSRPGSYWDDYQDIIRTGQGGVTLFDGEGMTVLYAPYELGPYAAGEVELHLSWEELTPLLGRGGLEHFGMTE